MKKSLIIINSIYAIIVAIEESKLIELLPFETEIKTKIKAVTLCAMVLLNALMVRLPKK